jgi:hypothetical protein
MATKIDLQKQAIRAALKIHEFLLGPALRDQQLVLPEDGWEELRRAGALLNLAHRRGWRAASHALCLDVDYVAKQLLRQIELLRQTLSPSWKPGLIATPSQILGDLLVLADEFEEIELDLKACWLAVTTGPIVLEETYLGPFRVELTWTRIGTERASAIVALDPHCAEDQHDVTHPHVRDQQLCEGEGAAAIKAALAGGRILDFFVLVRQILKTYNPASAHVTLNDWAGSRCCAGCSHSLSSDEINHCDRCGAESCDACSWGCHGCGFSVCSDCSADCAECGLRFCLRCLPAPNETDRHLCNSCLQKQQEIKDDEASQETPTAEPAPIAGPAAPTSAPAADALCLGQAPLPARRRANRSRRIRRDERSEPAPHRRRAARQTAVHEHDCVL